MHVHPSGSTLPPGGSHVPERSPGPVLVRSGASLTCPPPSRASLGQSARDVGSSSGTLCPPNATRAGRPVPRSGDPLVHFLWGQPSVSDTLIGREAALFAVQTPARRRRIHERLRARALTPPSPSFLCLHGRNSRGWLRTSVSVGFRFWSGFGFRDCVPLKSGHARRRVVHWPRGLDKSRTGVERSGVRVNN